MRTTQYNMRKQVSSITKALSLQTILQYKSAWGSSACAQPSTADTTGISGTKPRISHIQTFKTKSQGVRMQHNPWDKGRCRAMAPHSA